MSTNHPQCKTCGLPKIAQDLITDLLNSKESMKSISEAVSEVYEVDISERSMRRHVTGHMKIDMSKANSDPKEREEVEIDENGSGVVQTRAYKDPVDTSLISNVEDMLRNAGVDPDAFDVVGNIGVRSWDSAAFDREKNDFVTVRLHSYRIRIQAKKSPEDAIDLPLLWAEAMRGPSNNESSASASRDGSDRTFCAVFSDPQIGKTGSKGDTKALIERISVIREKLSNKVSETGADRAVFMDGGDIIEGFENVASQQFTNDLSLPSQLDLASTIEFDLIRVLADNLDNVDVMGVPSNHTGWRRFKDYLGNPADDYGLFILKQIKKQFGMSPDYSDVVDFHFPDQWDVSLNLMVRGYGLGLDHGYQVNNPNGIPGWWAKQTHGRQPVAESDILVTGHFHHFRMEQTGTNRFGKSKWWLQAPTLDNGSDWFRNKTGEESDPGLLIFEIEEGRGLDMSTVEILTAD